MSAESLSTMTGFEPVLPDFDREEEQASIVPAGLKTDKDIEREINRAGETAKPITPRLMTPANPEGAEPRKGMTFNENRRGSFRSQTILGAASETAQLEAVRSGGAAFETGGFQPSQFKNLPSRVQQRLREENAQPGVKEEKLRTAEDDMYEQLAYDLSPANLSVASVAGTLAGNLQSPESLGGLTGFIAKRAPSLAAKPIALAAADAALTNTVIDPVVQAIRLGSGAQENYELMQTLMAPVVGGAIGGGIGAARVAGSRFFGRPAPQGEAPAARPASTPEVKPDPVAQALDEAFPETMVKAPEPVVVPRETVAPPAQPARAAQEPSVTLIGPEPPRLQAHSVSTATGRQIDVAPVVVEASSLRLSSDAGFPADMQPRDRSRAASDEQIREIANSLTPERLGVSSEADRGAPIVGADGIVESGNGRIMAIRRAYADGGEAAQRYRAWVEGLGVDTTGIKEPVIVRQRLTALTPEERRAFAVEANQSATLSMSAPEKALADAQRLTPDTLTLIRSEDFAAAGNRDFMRAFAQSLPSSERGAFMTADGFVSSEGVTRARNAVLARAYGDSPILARITESADDDTKSISNALVAAAPEWAKLRAEIEAGAVRADMEMTPQLIEAVRRVVDIRSRNSNLDAFLRQQDAFDQVEPAVVGWMEMLYRPDRKRAAGKDAIIERVRYYAQEARKATEGDGLFSDLPPVRASDLMEAAGKRGGNDASTTGQADIFASRPAGSGASDAPRVVEGRGQEAGGSGRQVEPANRSDAAGPGRADSLDTPDIAPMSASRTGFAAGDGERRFGARRELPGEAEKPTALPPDIKPEEVKSFRVTEAIKELANDLGLKVEMDGRFTARNALGEYKSKAGVIRLRHAGDLETFSHEMAHAIDFRLRDDRARGESWKAFIRANESELRALDINQTDPAKKTATEGVAEFFRMYINNPAFAEKNAPNVMAAFGAWAGKEAPEVIGLLQKAARFSQIESGLTPTQAIESMIVDGLPNMSGTAYVKEFARVHGIPMTARMLVTEGSAKFFGTSAYIKAMMSDLSDAHFEYTGKPLERLWSKDPYKLYRIMPNAGGSAAQIVATGVRRYGAEHLPPVTRGFAEILKDALQGEPFDINGPVRKAFDGYLVARHAVQQYRRAAAGELARPPIRYSENEAIRAVAEYEARFPQFKQFAPEMYQFQTVMLERYKDAGFIKPEQFDAIIKANPERVPFFRDMDGQMSGGSGGGASLEKTVIKNFKGSTRDIIDPLDSIIRQVISMEQQIAQNRFVLALDAMAERAGPGAGRHIERVPNTELVGSRIDLEEALRQAGRAANADKNELELLIRHADELFDGEMMAHLFRAVETTQRGERILFGFKGGERIALKLGNNFMADGLFKAMEDMSGKQWDIFFAALGRFNGYFSQMVTNAPSFGLKNIAMDAMTRSGMVRDAGFVGRIPFAGHARGVYEMIFDKEFAEAYNMMGGIRGGVVSSFTRELQAMKPSYAIKTIVPETAGDKLNSAMHVLYDPKQWPSIPWKTVKTPFQGFVHIMEATETIGRVGQAKLVFNHLKRNGVDDYNATFGSTVEVNDLLDYGRKGAWLKQLTSTMPFLNAGMQGISAANRRLIYDPAGAMMQAVKRGGFGFVDAEKRAQLKDAAINWAIISAAAAPLTMWYFDMVKDDKDYQGMTPYMKRRYWRIPLGSGMVITIPKPFDLPGALISAHEAALEYQYRRDPKSMTMLGDSLEDAFIPRQFGGLGELAFEAASRDLSGMKDATYKVGQNLLGANPLVKTGFEAVSGKTLGFEGREGFPVIPDRLQGLPPEQQKTDRTSEPAKWLGKAFNVSPIQVDHILTGLGATMARDGLAIIDSIAADNPRMTKGEALNKAFFGALYRRTTDMGSAFTADVMKVMSGNTGQYTRLVNGYVEHTARGDQEQADIIYNRANDAGKTVITLMSNSRNFSTEVRQLHPLIRAQQMHGVLSNLRNELSDLELIKKDGGYRRGDKKDISDVPPEDARMIGRIIASLQIEEARNNLAIIKHPGYQDFQIIDVSGRYDAIRAISPKVAAELQDRLRKAHILPAERVAAQWPEVEKELLRNRDDAKLRQFLSAARAGRPRTTAAQP